MSLGEQLVLPVFSSEVMPSSLEGIAVCNKSSFFIFHIPPQKILLFSEFHLPFSCPGTWWCFSLLCTFLQSRLGWIMQFIAVLHVNSVTLLLAVFSNVI